MYWRYKLWARLQIPRYIWLRRVKDTIVDYNIPEFSLIVPEVQVRQTIQFTRGRKRSVVSVYGMRELAVSLIPTRIHLSHSS